MAKRLARSITLHIGTEKTGTTTIQNCLASNREALAAAGILYPKSPGRGNHAGLTYFAAGEGDRPPSPMLIGMTHATAPRYRETFMATLREEIAESPCEDIVFSNEHLSSRLRNPASVIKLVENMQTLAKEVRVLVYLRPQYELFPSSYSTTIKSGGTDIARAPKTVKRHNYNYQKILAMWEKPAGHANMIVRRFGKAYLKDGDLITDFFASLGSAVPPGVSAPRVLNPALDFHTLEFLRLANPLLPAPPEDGGERERLPLIKALEAISERNTPLIAAEILSQIDAIFRDGNREVAEHYFPELNGELFPPFKADANHVVPELTVAKAVEIAVHLWLGKTEELKRAREKVKARKAGV